MLQICYKAYFFIIRFVRWKGYTLLYKYHPNRDRSHKRPGNRQGHEEGAEGEAVRGPADTPTGFGKEGQEGKNKYAQEGEKTYGHKKRSTAVLQPFVNLKSNTMKNTVQRYAFLYFLQVFQEKSHVL